MNDIDKFYPKIKFDKNIKLIKYAHYEIRALKSTLLKQEIKQLRTYLSLDFDEHRNIYGFITGDENSDRALTLIRKCAPLLFPQKGLKNITYSRESFLQSVFLIDYGYDDGTPSKFRLYYTALELVFMRASFEELRALIAFLIDDTLKLQTYDFKEWVYRELDYVNI